MMSNFQNFNFQINSQNCNENSIFVALETGKRSGVDFAKNAIENGAKAVISQHPVLFLRQISAKNFQNNGTIYNILVEDVLDFLQKLARHKFNFLTQNGTKTIAITGSVGKTTTKEMMLETLSQHGKTFATQGNFNNHIGLPLTLLNAPQTLDFLVLEMGMNHSKEIEFLTKIAPCKWNLITNIRENHSGNFSDGQSGVLKAKFEILSSNGKCFVLEETIKMFQKNDFLQAKYPNAKIIAINPQVLVNFDGENTHFQFQNTNFKLEGIYSQKQVEMLCLAIATIEDILNIKLYKISLQPLKGRGKISVWKGKKVVNESYNASPSSMKNALENFAKMECKKLVILGEMQEISNQKEQHFALLPYFSNFDAIFTVGTVFEGVKSSNSTHFQCYEELLQFLQKNPLNFDAILVKSSNGVGLWKLFDEFFI